MSFKSDICTRVAHFVATNLEKGSGPTNSGRLLFTVFMWQEISKYAKEQLELAWAAVQGQGKPLGEDDDLRALERGEHVVLRARYVNAVVDVAKGRETFDLDLFIKRVSRKYGIDRAALEGMAARAKTEGKRPLTKRVIEVEKQKVETRGVA